MYMRGSELTDSCDSCSGEEGGSAWLGGGREGQKVQARASFHLIM